MLVFNRETLAGLIAKLKVRQAQIELSGLMKGNYLGIALHY